MLSAFGGSQTVIVITACALLSRNITEHLTDGW